MNIPHPDIIDVPPPGQTRPRRRKRAGAAAAALLAAGSLATYKAYGSDSPVPGDPAPLAGAETRAVGDGEDSYAAVVDRVAPTVVTIRSERRARAPQQLPFMQDPFFRDFFGNGRGGEQLPPARQQGLGSGVIVTADGYILTNHHVIDGAEEITVELSDRRSFDAKVVGSDPPSDLAVLKIDGRNLPVLALANSDVVRVGDVVLAVGNPMGVGQTVTMGIISAKGRATGLGDGSFEDFLQTDAPINQGNSGGALVNTRGELVGINSQILSPSGGNIGIGFAIPANMAHSVMQALITEGQVRRGMLGVTVQGVTPDIAKSLNLQDVSGALVSDVRAGSAADQAGVERGDVITAVKGQRMVDSNALRNHVAQLKPGSQVELTVIRDGRTRTLTATLDELPSQDDEAQADAAPATNSSLGLSLEPLRSEQAERLGVSGGEGLLVTGVASSSAAADAGIRRGDVIVEVNGSTPKAASDLRSAVAEAGDRPLLILVQRGDSTLYLTVKARS